MKSQISLAITTSTSSISADAPTVFNLSIETVITSSSSSSESVTAIRFTEPERSPDLITIESDDSV